MSDTFMSEVPTYEDLQSEKGAVEIRLPDGRILHVWHHDCDNCTSVDVWTTTADGRDHAVSERTGDKTRAPVGVMGMTDGMRTILDTGRDPVPETNKYPEASTTVLVWNDKKGAT